MFWFLQRMDLGECIKVHDLALRADYEIASKEQEYFFELDVSFTHPHIPFIVVFSCYCCFLLSFLRKFVCLHSLFLSGLLGFFGGKSGFTQGRLDNNNNKKTYQEIGLVYLFWIYSYLVNK